MKPAPFEYHAPTTLEEAVGILHDLDDEDAKCLAGGQSLVPMMNLRLARPSHLVDLTRCTGLDGITQNGDEWRLGALTRHVDIEDSPVLREQLPLLPFVASHIGYRQVRNRGTVGGAVCHADPVAEWPMIMRLLDAAFDVARAGGERTIPAGDFFVSSFMPDLAHDEVLSAIRFRTPTAPWGWGFSEFARKTGDYAVVAAGAIVEADGATARRARVALAGVASTPVRATEAEASLTGAALDDAEAIRQVADTAADEFDPPADLHGSSAYRRQLIRAQVGRALADACRRAANTQG